MSCRDSAQDLIIDWLIRRDGPAGPEPVGTPIRYYDSGDDAPDLETRKRLRQGNRTPAGYGPGAIALRSEPHSGVVTWPEAPPVSEHDDCVAPVLPLIEKRIDPALADMVTRYRNTFLALSGSDYRADQRRREAQTQARLVADQQRHAAVLAQVDGTLRDVTDLHGPELGDALESRCAGCEYDGYDAGPPAWPCSTFDLVERAVTNPTTVPEVPDHD